MEVTIINNFSKDELDISKKLINDVDLTSAVNRLEKVDKWSKKQALEAVKQYRNFLFLKRKYGYQYALPPSYDIDEVWHAHILHTKEYFDFCEKVFGSYLHHHPHHGKNNEITDEDLSSVFENETQRLYFVEFGEYIQSIKPLPLLFAIKRVIEHLKKFIKRQKLDSTRLERI